MTTLPRHDRAEQVDLELRQRAVRIESDFYGFCALARESLAEGYWARFAKTPEDYFEERLGISYRSMRRRLSVLEAIGQLPPSEHEAALRALTALGSHKAGILAPAIRAGQQTSGATWHQWIEQAQVTSLDALQEQVSEQLGLARRSAQEPGARFLTAILNQMPDDGAREEVERTFAVARRVADTRNNVGAFLAICREFLATYR